MEIRRKLSQDSSEIPRILSRENPVKMSTHFRGISRNPFLGISCNPFRGISRNPFWGISRNPFHGISHNSFRGISHSPIWGISCTNLKEFFWRIIGENVDQIWGNSWEFPEKSSLEPFTGNFLGTIPKISSEISWDILSIFLSKFTNQDLDPLLVNILTTNYIATPTFRSIANFLSQNVIVVFVLAEVVLYFVFSDNWIVKNK